MRVTFPRLYATALVAASLLTLALAGRAAVRAIAAPPPRDPWTVTAVREVRAAATAQRGEARLRVRLADLQHATRLADRRLHRALRHERTRLAALRGSP